MNRQFALALGAVSAVVLAAAPSAKAKEFVYGSFLSLKAAENRDGIMPMIKAIERDSKGAIRWTLVANPEAVSANGSLAAIRDRRIDAGFVLQPFTRPALATNNTIFDMAFFGTDAVAVSGASIETTLLDCPACQREYRKNNSVFLGGYALTPYMLLCRRKITTIEGLADARIRAVGASARWIRILGAEPVWVPAPKAVPALRRGTVDCAVAAAQWLDALGYMDVTESIIDFTFGSSRGIGLMVMNRKAWNSLTRAEKRIILKHLPMAQARVTINGYVERDKRTLEAAARYGITIVPGGPAFETRLAQHLENETKAIPAQLRSICVKNPEKIMAAFRRNLEKWQGLSADIGNDVGKFAKALEDHIYTKVDPSRL